MTIDELYTEQCQTGCRELAERLTGNIQTMNLENLRRNAELLAYRFKGLDKSIMKNGILPTDWEKSHGEYLGFGKD